MVATRRPIKSWVVPKFDHRDASLVLYYPLWYQYSDMTGSTIYSYDRNRHSGTVTGATWSSQGRTFDGIDDQILTGSITHNIDTGDFTVLVWARCTRTPSGAGDDAILAFGAYAPALYFDADSTVESRFGIYWGAWYPSGSSLVANTWYLLGLHRSGTTVSWSINAAQTVNTYSIATSIANGALVLSSENTTANAKGIQGSIGEVALWTRFLPLAERQRFLQATKWRY